MRQPLREGDDPLAHRHPREDVLDQVGGGLGHAAGATRRPQAAALAGERDQDIVTAGVAVRAGEPSGQDPALEIGAQLALDVAGERRSVGVVLAPVCQPGLEVLLRGPVEHAALGTATAVEPRRTGTGRGANRA